LQFKLCVPEFLFQVCSCLVGFFEFVEKVEQFGEGCLVQNLVFLEGAVEESLLAVGGLAAEAGLIKHGQKDSVPAFV
jgi:hypothetical protein